MLESGISFDEVPQLRKKCLLLTLRDEKGQEPQTQDVPDLYQPRHRRRIDPAPCQITRNIALVSVQRLCQILISPVFLLKCMENLHFERERRVALLKTPTVLRILQLPFQQSLS